MLRRLGTLRGTEDTERAAEGVRAATAGRLFLDCDDIIALHSCTEQLLGIPG